MGSSLPGLRTQDPPLGSPSTLAKKNRAHACNSPIFVQLWNPHIILTKGLMPSFGTLGQLLESYYFCELGAHIKFWNHPTIFENTPLVPTNMS